MYYVVMHYDVLSHRTSVLGVTHTRGQATRTCHKYNELLEPKVYYTKAPSIKRKMFSDLLLAWKQDRLEKKIADKCRKYQELGKELMEYENEEEE